MYSVQRALHPEKSSIETRLATFFAYDNQWPSYRIRATPQQMAEAGLFFQGASDKVKCWYCNGGLCNWEEDDDPWFEHAKFYPHCEFVLHERPPNYVDDVITAHYGNRNATVRARVETSVYRVIPGEPQRLLQTTNNIQMRVDDFLTHSQEAASLRTMGFAENFIRTAVERELEEGNQVPDDIGNLLNSLVNLRPQEERVRPERDYEELGRRRADSGGSECSSSSAGSAESNGCGGQNSEQCESLSESMVHEVQRLREARLCKRCRREPASMVFIPCGHIHSCSECAFSYDHCPVCGSHISERIRGYIG